MSNPAPYQIHALELGPMENFVYLIHDHTSNRAAVVDPAWDIPAVLQLAEQLEVTISDILLTHSHHDHINGIEELLEHSEAKIHLMKAEAEFWGESLAKPELHHGGDRIQLGDSEIQLLHTPGHTPGSACYRLDDNLITGDTLFVFGCGRCDLHGGDPEQMFHTLKQIKEELPAQTLIHPGHNYAVKTSATLQEQIDGNPFMHFEQPDQFIDYRMHQHDKLRDSPYAPLEKQQLRVSGLLR